MRQPTVALLTICLNETEHLIRLWRQQKDWPGLIRWVFVEFCDRAFADANPNMVRANGLSVDGTSEFLHWLATQDSRVRYVPLGFTDHTDKALGKVKGKARALEEVADVRSDYFIIADADEFHCQADQSRILEWMDRYPGHNAFIFPRREIWHPPMLAHEPLFRYEVVGGFWGIPCSHWFRWSPGVAFTDCHNTPTDAQGRPLNDTLMDFREHADAPQMIHVGYASNRETRAAKARYYARRGEGTDPQRKWYVKSRRAWFNYRPGVELPRGAVVRPYDGPIPEVFREGQ